MTNAPHLSVVPEPDDDETILLSLHRHICEAKDQRIARLEWLLSGKRVQR